MTNRIVGEAACPVCDSPTNIRLSEKNNHLYYVCQQPADGGCGSQTFCRYEKGDEKLAAKIGRWRCDETKERFGYGEPANDQNPVANDDEPETKQSWFDKKVI